ncbi:MAG: hypothetical protein F9K40_01600 [Kofleriaceae bacterium]|nr:MAG: hypothetical protein F9K40_01600 [Kofleriaceae bacterium]MBZ0231816.1 hypothetical protein [Kofleriaceae bacterium]
MMRRLGLVISVSVAACGGDDGGSGDPDAAADGDPGGDGAPCERIGLPRSGPRFGVVSFPYTAAGENANTYRLFTLDETGSTITLSGATFEMGRSTIGTIAFTPDGELGFVAQEDGSLGVFRLSGAQVEVLHARFQGSFYADRLVMGALGQYLYVVDPNTRENGGGIYRVRIGCDDAISDEGPWLAGSSLGDPLFDDGRLVIPARELGGTSPAGESVHLVDVRESTPARVTGVDAFGDDMAIFGGAALTGDGRFALVGDNQGVFQVPNRVAVVERIADTLTARQVLTPIEDPLSIIMSPFDDAALVVSGFGDAFIALDHDPEAAMPFSVRGQVAYAGARPELPGNAVLIEYGSLRGLVLVPENLGIRRVRFAAGGTITDLGKTATGASGYENITGALGIQP